MAVATIDDLLAAVEQVQALKSALLAHDALFLRVADRLSDIERRLVALEGAKARRARP